MTTTTAAGDLERIFSEYSSKTVVGTMDSTRFLKFCRDAKLFSTKFRPENVDVVFAKFKDNGKRHITFSGFISCLAEIAEKKGRSTDELIEEVIQLDPKNHASTVTSPVSSRFHDDQRTYTGVHKTGGPTVVDLEKRNLSELVDRNVKSNQSWQQAEKNRKMSEASVGISSLQIEDNAQRNSNTFTTPTKTGARGGTITTPTSSSRPNSARKPSLDNGINNNIFKPKLLSGEPSTNKATSSSSGVFTTPNKTPRKDTFGVDLKSSTTSPRSGKSLAFPLRDSTTTPRSSKANGLLTPTPTPRTPTSSKKMEQTLAQTQSTRTQTTNKLVSPRPSTSSNGSSKRLSTATTASNATSSYSVPDEVSGKLGGLKTIFREYVARSSTAAEEGIDGAKFLKFCQDMKLFDNHFKKNEVDLVFAKYKVAGNRFVLFQGFYSALLDIANRKNVDFDVLLESIAETAACNSSVTNNPNGTIPSPNRFHDDQRMYTGTHKMGGPITIDNTNKDLSELLTRAKGTGGSMNV